MNKFIENNSAFILFGLVSLIILLPIGEYGLIEKQFKNIYQDQFDTATSEIILSTVKTYILIQLYSQKLFFLIIRVFFISLVIKLFIQTISNIKVEYKIAVKIMTVLEMGLIIGDYITLGIKKYLYFNNLLDIQIVNQIMNLSFYFKIDSANRYLINFLNTFTPFFILYIIGMIYLLNRYLNLKANSQYAVFVAIFIIILIQTISPIELILGTINYNK